MAKRGVKRVHALSAGKEKEGNSVYLGTDGCGGNIRPFVLLKGSQIDYKGSNRGSKSQGVGG